jgi:(R,R)-butanediol dehydrogenase/meso-butanediol dehydrogenase/diacetyl reductase
MRALVFDGELSVQSVADPEPESGQLVVAVKRCGICGTDLHATQQHDEMHGGGIILGHEYVGEVVAASADVVQHWPTGSRVAGLPFHSCGHCVQCLGGRPFQCGQKKIVGLEVAGGFAEYLAVDAHNTVRLPESISWDEGALIEPLAVGLHAVRYVREMAARKVLILGAGPVGLAVAFWCRFLGAADVLVSEPDSFRADWALRYGATASMDPKKESVEAACARELGGAPDIVFECSGVPGMIRQAIAASRHGGQLLVVGFSTLEEGIVPAEAMVKELQLNFALAYYREDFEFIARMIVNDRIDVAGLVTQKVSMEGLPQAFSSLLQTNQQCKVMMQL